MTSILKSPLRRSASPAPVRWAQATAALAAVATATVVASLLDAHVSLAVLALVYLAAVLALSYWLGFFASALAAALAVLALNFFFIPPRGTLTVHATENLLTLAALLGVGMLVSSLTSRLRSTAERALDRERRAQSLQLLAGRLSAMDDRTAIAHAVRQTVLEAVGADASVAVRTADGDLAFLTPHDDMPPRERDAMLHCSREGQALGPGTGRWDTLGAWYLPLRAGDESFGVMAIASEGRTPADRDHLQAIADLAAGALQRAHHAAALVAAHREAESQRLRNALLAAVSHDFRTPLASIVGAVSSLQSQHERLDAARRAQLLMLIEDEARHLGAMTENTLQWVRLSSAAPLLRLDWESVEELVGSVLARVRRRDPGRRIQAHVPNGLPLIRADAALLAQLLENLLDNALKYSPQAIELTVGQRANELHIEVLDRGPGVEPQDVPGLFDTFVRGASARGTRGAGLGLAVSRAIAEAHGGSLQFRPRHGGGSCFSLYLPVEEAPTAPLEAGN